MYICLQHVIIIFAIESLFLNVLIMLTQTKKKRYERNKIIILIKCVLFGEYRLDMTNRAIEFFLILLTACQIVLILLFIFYFMIILFNLCFPGTLTMYNAHVHTRTREFVKRLNLINPTILLRVWKNDLKR